MKKNYKYIAAIFLGGLIGFSACTDDFESFNTNEAGFPDKSKEQEFNKYGIPLGVVQQGIYFNYDWGVFRLCTRFQPVQRRACEHDL